MSEKTQARFDPDDIRVASIDQTDTANPGTGIKDDGQPPGVIPPAEHHNWLFWKYYLALLNMNAAVPRYFDNLAEALDLVDGEAAGVPIVQGERVLIDGLNAGGNVYQLGDTAVVNATGNPVLDMACDGQRWYRAVGSNVQAVASLGGAAGGWTQAPGAVANAIRLDCDGLYVYVAYDDNDVYILDRADGSTVGSITALTYAINDIAANGVHLLVMQQNGASTHVKVYDTLGATPNHVGDTAATGAAPTAVALDQDQAYLCGGSASGIFVRAFDPTSPGSFLWSVGLPGVAGSAYDIKADGAFVYVVSTPGEGDAAVWCLRRDDGGIVWRADLGGAEGRKLAVDHRYCWVSDDSNLAYCLDKSSGARVWVSGAVTFTVRCADGFLVFGDQPSGSYFVHGRRVAELRRFAIVSGTDPGRRPFPREAMPEAEPPLGASTVSQHEEIAEATSTITTSSATDVLATGMQITPPRGTYHVWFSGSLTHTSTDDSAFTSIYAAGVQVPSSERFFRRGNQDIANAFCCVARVTVDGTQTIEGQWRTTAATASMYQRSLLIRRIAE